MANLFNLAPFRSLRSSLFPDYLGVDIGTTSIKAVEVKPGKGRPRVINYAFLEASDYLGRTNSAIQTSALKLFEKDVAELLGAVLREMKPHTTEVLASIPVFSAFLTVLDFPEMTKAELNKALIFQVRQYVPLPISEITYEWLKVGEYEDDKGFRHQQILVMTFPREHIEKYQRIFKLAGLRLRALEIESLGLIRSLIAGDLVPTIIVDIGSRSTNIVFVEGGFLKFNSQADFAGASLTQALATSLNINPLRAEDLKKERGVVGGGADYELSTIMLPFLDVILNEVNKAYYQYKSQFPGAAKMERVILSGGGASLLGIDKYFTRELNLPTVKASPLLRFEYPNIIEPLVNELNPLMSIALGLTLREFV